ncbi:uncharacterized protein LOC131636778 [Vicia villosa]|uniref:uncharacterized protein LOC131636778 n=1 Tax=Vicia villosa TaxID=3911 RepID=UPI00273A98C9|nr:uncharacterized protein LOC131636778 [Vicia villosa]
MVDNEEEGGFVETVTTKLGEGIKIPFWTGRWIGHKPLCSSFPSLYQMIENKNSSILEMGRWKANNWLWGLHEYNIQQDQEPGGNSGVYVVGEYYNKLLREVTEEEGQPDVKVALNVLWQSWLSSKVKIFGWRLLKDRLATKQQLIKRGIIEPNDESLCVFGYGQLEDSIHLFLNCPFVRKVWEKILVWLGINVVTDTDCPGHFMQLMENMRSSCSIRRAAVFWMALCWSVWNQRNNIIFSSAVGDIEEIVHGVKMYSWWWLALGTKHKVYCSFYEWNHSPLDFI